MKLIFTLLCVFAVVLFGELQGSAAYEYGARCHVPGYMCSSPATIKECDAEAYCKLAYNPTNGASRQQNVPSYKVKE